MLTVASITIALFILCIISYFTDREELTAASIILIIVIGIFGWGFYGCSVESSRTKEEKAIVTEVLKGKHIVIVSTICPNAKSNNTLYTNGEIDYINDTTYFYWYIEYNHYGIEDNRTLRFRNK